MAASYTAVCSNTAGLPPGPLPLLGDGSPRWSDGIDNIACDVDGWYLELASAGPVFRPVDLTLRFQQTGPPLTSQTAWTNVQPGNWPGATLDSLTVT